MIIDGTIRVAPDRVCANIISKTLHIHGAGVESSISRGEVAG